MDVQLITTIGAIIVAALGSPIILTYVKNYLEVKKKTNNVNKRIENDKVILDKLYNILYMTNADRALIYQLHPESNPMYMSCTYEVVKTGVSKEIQNLQGLLLSEFNDLLMSLKDNGYMCINNVNCLDNDTKLRTTLKNKGVVSAYAKSIFNSSGNLKAYIGIDNTNPEHTISEDDIQLISEQAAFLEKYLGEYKNV
jgi:NACalpha-BTF3-like transcription factor